MILHPSLNKISAYMDGTLSDSVIQKIQSHVQHCDKCKKDLHLLKATEQLVQSPSIQFDSITDNVMSSIQDRKWNTTNEIIGNIQTVMGNVAIRTGTNGNDLEAFPDFALRKGDTLQTLGESKALVDWNDGSQLYINKETELDFHTSTYPLTLRLGEIFSMMKPQAIPFEIKTPSAVLSVIGTDFDTEVNKKNQTILKVLKGKVAFKNKTGDTLAKKNQQVEASEYTKPTVSPIQQKQNIENWANSLNPISNQKGAIMKKLLIFVLILLAIVMMYYFGRWMERKGRSPQSTQISTPVPGETDLMREASQGNTDKVKELLAKGADVNAKDKNNSDTALMKASLNGHSDTVKVLIDKGSEVNAINGDGRTALMMAAIKGHTDTVNVLLTKGAEVNAKDKNDFTALLFTANDGFTDTIQVLVTNGAEVNAIENKGRTALMYAASNGKTDTVKVLIDKGADVNVKDKSGAPALMFASSNGQTDTVQALIEKGADINSKDNNGRSILMLTSSMGKTDTVKVLINKGAEVNAIDNNGFTALMYSAAKGQTDTAKTLIEKGADINMKDSKGATALTFAVTEKQDDVVKLLKSAGATQ